MKTNLTKEESHELIALGIPPELASMVLWKQTEDWQRKSVLGDKEHLQYKPFNIVVMGFERFDCKDIFTLTDILSILPKEIDGYYLNMASYGNEWYVCYEKIKLGGKRSILKTYTSPELIDAIYKLLAWCAQDKHLNFKQESHE